MLPQIVESTEQWTFFNVFRHFMYSLFGRDHLTPVIYNDNLNNVLKMFLILLIGSIGRAVNIIATSNFFQIVTINQEDIWQINQ